MIREYVKCSGYYFLMLQLLTLAALLIDILFNFVFAFFVKDVFLFLSIEIVIGILVEPVLAFAFIKRQVGKRTTLKEILIPFGVALVLHFLVALINRFYVYTAGVAANSAARLWEAAVRGQSVVMKDVALWRSILTFLPIQALLFLSAYLAYRRAKSAAK